MDREEIKRVVGYRAAEFVQPGMKVGLGTGSTAFYFIEKLIERCRSGLKIEAVASSKRSFAQAEKGGIPMIDINQITSLDLTVDGADQIDHQKRMIKGGGGALVREKIVAAMSREMIVIIDEHKLSSLLGKCKLPVEIVPFGIKATISHMEKQGFFGKMRTNQDFSLYITDNGNHIIDLSLPEERTNPEQDHDTLLHIPGVVDTGFFFHLSGRIIVGFDDGQVIVKS